MEVHGCGCFRVDKNRNYTVMSNYHLRDTNMSLKAIGLLSKMLSLTDEWDYTTRGLASICKEGVDAIGAALKELEKCGYLVHRQLRDSRGRITDTEYTIYEYPHTPSPDTTSPDTSRPDTENPDMEEPDTEEPYPIKTAQLNTDKPIPEKRNTDSVSTDPSNPDPSSTDGHPALMPAPVPAFGYDGMGYEETRELVMENLDYDIMTERYERSRLDEIVELVTETLCSGRPTIVVSGEEYPAQLVKNRLMKLTSSHIEYAFDCIDKNTTYVRNIKKYLLAVLFNAPSTIDHYYTTLVNHDLYGTGSRGY